MVCFYHYAGRGGTISESWDQSPRPDVPDPVPGRGLRLPRRAVLLRHQWLRDLHEQLGPDDGDFFRSRIARLYPAYWVAIVIITVAAYLLPVVVHPLRTDEILVNFTMLQQPMGVHRVLGVCWTLWAEVRFYALFALLVVWKGVNYRSVVIFCLCGRSPARSSGSPTTRW